jgi:hypothetical protein
LNTETTRGRGLQLIQGQQARAGKSPPPRTVAGAEAYLKGGSDEGIGFSSPVEQLHPSRASHGSASLALSDERKQLPVYGTPQLNAMPPSS